MEKLIIKANSKPQLQFLENAPFNDDTYYGGAAGPGKTYGEVILPIYHRFHEVTGFRMQIFRETENELHDNIIPLQHEIYPHTGGIWNEQKKEWTWRANGILIARIRNCFMSRAGEWKRYQGGNNTVQAFDEANNIHKDNIEKISIWNRSGCGINPFRVFASNPGGISHFYFKKIFFDKCPPMKDGPMIYSELGKMYWQPMKASAPVNVYILEESKTHKRKIQFIPARIFDNEDLLRNNPSYLANLLSMNEEDRRKFIDGDYNVVTGQIFEKFRSEIHLIRSTDIKIDRDNMRLIIGVDYGNTTVMIVLAMDRSGTIYVLREKTDIGKARERKARESATWLKEYGFLDVDAIGDTDMFANSNEVPNAKTAAQCYQKEKIKLSVVSKKAPEGKKFRQYQVDLMRDLLDWEKDNNGLFIKYPKIYICEDTCPMLAETMPALQKDPDYPEIIDEKEPKNDHWFRACIYGIINLRPPVRKSKRQELLDFYQKQLSVPNI
jgi:hypothetical protein